MYTTVYTQHAGYAVQYRVDIETKNAYDEIADLLCNLCSTLLL